LRPKNGNIEYLVNLLEAIDYFPYVSGAAQPKLTADNLGNVKIPVPPRDEQDKIAKETTKENRKFTKKITIIKRQLELLQEYRMALISAAVTGKIDVRNNS